MKSLVHNTFEKVPSGYDYFVTVTLPKCHYRKNVVKQKEVMDRKLRELAITLNIFNAHGCYEFTKKGNVHAHMMANICIMDPSEKEQNVMAANAILKTKGIHDVQIIDNYEKCSKYLLKDVYITKDIFKKVCEDKKIKITQATICPLFYISTKTTLTLRQHYDLEKSLLTEPVYKKQTQLDIKELEKTECECTCFNNNDIKIK